MGVKNELFQSLGDEIPSQLHEPKKVPSKVTNLVIKRPKGFNKGFYYEPTIFDNVKDDFTIMRVETFGPLVPMLSFKTFDEVIERANNHELGLSSYICTNSMERAHLAKPHMIPAAPKTTQTKKERVHLAKPR